MRLLPVTGRHPQTRLRGFINGYTQVSNEDAVLLEGRTLQKHYAGYVVIRQPKGVTLLHRLILGDPDSEIDHLDRNKLNNQRSNLRLVDSAENKWNTGVRSTNKSGVTGVSWDPRTNKWKVNLMVRGKAISLGRHARLEDAVRVRREAEDRYRGGVE